MLLPNSGVAVDIPLLPGTYDESTPDASVTPDVLVAPSLHAVCAGRDLDVKNVRQLIGSRR